MPQRSDRSAKRTGSSEGRHPPATRSFQRWALPVLVAGHEDAVRPQGVDKAQFRRDFAGYLDQIRAVVAEQRVSRGGAADLFEVGLFCRRRLDVAAGGQKVNFGIGHPVHGDDTMAPERYHRPVGPFVVHDSVVHDGVVVVRPAAPQRTGGAVAGRPGVEEFPGNAAVETQHLSLRTADPDVVARRTPDRFEPRGGQAVVHNAPRVAVEVHDHTAATDAIDVVRRRPPGVVDPLRHAGQRRVRPPDSV